MKSTQCFMPIVIANDNKSDILDDIRGLVTIRLMIMKAQSKGLIVSTDSNYTWVSIKEAQDGIEIFFATRKSFIKLDTNDRICK